MVCMLVFGRLNRQNNKKFGASPLCLDTRKVGGGGCWACWVHDNMKSRMLWDFCLAKRGHGESPGHAEVDEQEKRNTKPSYKPARSGVCVLRHFRPIQLFVTLWAVAFQAPLSMGFSKQVYWSRLPYPPPGDLPHPGIEPVSLHVSCIDSRFFTTTASLGSVDWRNRAKSPSIR